MSSIVGNLAIGQSVVVFVFQHIANETWNRPIVMISLQLRGLESL